MASNSTPPPGEDMMMELAREMRAALNRQAAATSDSAQANLKQAIEDALVAMPRTHVPFPPCADVLLSTIHPPEAETARDFAAMFFDYFQFGNPSPLLQAGEAKLLNASLAGKGWPPQWCLPQPNISLNGFRHIYLADERPFKRLLTGDLIWLFYMERMGIFKILGAILDDYASGGKYPVPSDSLNGLVLESMTRQVKMGTSSGVKDRDGTYRRCLGWTSESGRKIGSAASINADFSVHFHKFIQLALEYFKDLRLAETIRGDLATSRASVATLTSIKDTLVLLKQSLDPFGYGRNDTNTLSGIVWAISAFGLLGRLVRHLGIPVNFNDPDKFVPAAYELLVLNRAPTAAESRRYTSHIDAAQYGRRILLDIEAFDVHDTSRIQTWLAIAENSIEGYRTAYRTLTGNDLGLAGQAVVEQAA